MPWKSALLPSKGNSLPEHRTMTRMAALEAHGVPADSHRVIDL